MRSKNKTLPDVPLLENYELLRSSIIFLQQHTTKGFILYITTIQFSFKEILVVQDGWPFYASAFRLGLCL